MNGNKANCVIMVEFHFLLNFLRVVDVILFIADFGEVGTSSGTGCCCLVGPLSC